jgi:hypothetical protein
VHLKAIFTVQIYNHCNKHRVTDECKALEFFNDKRKCRQKRQKKVIEFRAVGNIDTARCKSIQHRATDRLYSRWYIWITVPQWYFCVRNWAKYMENGLCLVLYGMIWYMILYMIWYDIWYDMIRYDIYCNWLSTRWQSDKYIISWSRNCFIFMKPALLSARKSKSHSHTLLIYNPLPIIINKTIFPKRSLLYKIFYWSIGESRLSTAVSLYSTIYCRQLVQHDILPSACTARYTPITNARHVLN